MPIEITSDSENIGEQLQFRPLKIADENENILIPLFSDDEELIKLNIECSVINIYSKNLAEMISETQEYDGIAIGRSPYYVRMAAAWLLATSLAKLPEQTRAYVNDSSLPEDVKRLYVRKARESFRTRTENPF